MSAAPQASRAVTAPSAAAPPLATPGRTRAPALAAARRLSVRLGQEWLPRATWAIGRTGRAGLLGLALLLAAGLFLVSTHLEVTDEVQALRQDLVDARRQAGRGEAAEVVRPTGLPPLQPRAATPAILRRLFDEARRARLSVDTGKYELDAGRGGGLVRYRITFPVAGPYPQVRSFLDAALAGLPEVALEELVLERKSIADGTVEAQIRMAVYTAATPSGPAGAPGDGRGRPREASARAGQDRVTAPTHAAALFAPHSWYVPPPPRPRAPPPPPPPAPEPTAPPLPYRFVGSYAPGGSQPVYFLARGDRVIDAHVGDRLDGVYQLESATGGQLVFLYLPLHLRQSLPAGASN